MKKATISSINLDNVTSIITHAGGAHMDDLVTLCIALFLCRNVRSVVRRDPTPDELSDNTCLVLDVGGEHSPENLVFDHHQFERSAEPDCALSLFAKSVTLDEGQNLHEVLSQSLWYSRVVFQDSKGPFAAAKKFGVDADCYQSLTSNPITGALLKMLSTGTKLNEVEYQMMAVIGQTIVESALESYSRQKELRSLCGYDEVIVGGSIVGHILILDSSDLTGLNQFIDTELNTRDPKNWAPVVATITKDPRGDGWKLFRYKDNAHIDFSRVSEEPSVTFAHANGFVACTTNIPSHEASDLVRKSYR